MKRLVLVGSLLIAGLAIAPAASGQEARSAPRRGRTAEVGLTALQVELDTSTPTVGAERWQLCRRPDGSAGLWYVGLGARVALPEFPPLTPMELRQVEDALARSALGGGAAAAGEDCPVPALRLRMWVGERVHTLATRPGPDGEHRVDVSDYELVSTLATIVERRAQLFTRRLVTGAVRDDGRLQIPGYLLEAPQFALRPGANLSGWALLGTDREGRPASGLAGVRAATPVWPGAGVLLTAEGHRARPEPTELVEVARADR